MSVETVNWVADGTARLTATAEADFLNIVARTLDQFGDRQARIYADVQSAVLSALVAGPTTVGVRDRREIGKGLFTLHVTRNGRKAGSSCCSA
jgi:toxin ParE1/3/4